EQDIQGSRGSITIYSGRLQSLVGPLLKQFSKDTGIGAHVRYGEPAELAATMLEEGGRSPADVFYSPDAGALGAMQQRGRLAVIPDQLLSLVDPKFRSTEGKWVGVSGRARVLAYNTKRVNQSELPPTILGLTDRKWKGRIGWTPA